MKIQYCSDLHLEFPENRKFLARNPLQPKGDILVLAGDMVTFRELDNARDFINFASDHYSAVYWVPGNHEYYGSDITDKPGSFCEKIRPNFYLINNQSIVHGRTRILLSTLWSKISPQREWEIQRSLNDFSIIKYQKRNFTTHDVAVLHKESLAFLSNELCTAGEQPTVVVTHHVPTLMNYPSIYKNSPLTDAFATELFDLILDSGAACWIYGHHHVNVPEFNVGNTKLLTNQLGYVHQREYYSFQRGAVVEVGD